MAISLAALACGLLAVGMGAFLIWGPDEVRIEAEMDSPVDRPQLAADATLVASATPASSPPWLTGPLQIGGDIPLPDGLAVLRGNTPFGKGGISAWGIERFSTALPGGSGVARIGGPSTADGPGLSFAQDESGAVFASICLPEECSHEGFDPATKFTTTFYRSDDGGLSWAEIGSRPGQWFVRGAIDGEPLAVSFGARIEWIRATSNLAIRRPENARELGLVTFRGQIAWLHRELPVVISETGSTLYKLDLGQPPTAHIEELLAPASGELAIYWRDPSLSEGGFLTVETRDGRRRTLDVGNAVIRLFAFVTGPAGPGPALLVGGATEAYPGTCPEGQIGYGMSPAILDVDVARMAFIREILVDKDCPAGGTWAFASWEGSFARVVAPESCLNVRQQPGLAGPVIDCVADGALLVLSGSTTEADDTRWTAVRTLGGKAGWAAREFLDLPPGPGN